ncbi:hypothetical protein ABPG74_016136 [Tetrahymena malaccensis]
MSSLKDRLLERINSLNFSDSEEESNYKKSLQKNNHRDVTFPNKKLKFDDNERKMNTDLPRSVVDKNKASSLSRNQKQTLSMQQKHETKEKYNGVEENNQTFADIERRIQQLELDLSKSLMSSQNNYNNSQHKIGDESSINYSDSLRDQKGEYEYYDAEMQQHNKELEQITQTMGNVLDNKNFSQISYLPPQSNQHIQRNQKNFSNQNNNCTSCNHVGSFNCISNQNFQDCLCCKQAQHHFHSCHSNHTFNTEQEMQYCPHQTHNSNVCYRQNANSTERNQKNGQYIHQDNQQTYLYGRFQKNMNKNFESFEKETQELNRRVAEIKKELENDNESSENSDYESSNKQKDRSLLDSNSFYRKQKSNDVSIDSVSQRRPQKSILKHSYSNIDQKIQNSQMKLLQELEKSYSQADGGSGLENNQQNYFLQQKYQQQQQDRSSYYTNYSQSNEQKYQFSQGQNNNYSNSNQIYNDKENNYHSQNYNNIITTPFQSRPLFNDADKTELLNQLAREKQLLEEIANLRRQNNQLASQNGSRNGSRNASRKESRHDHEEYNKSRNNSNSRSPSLKEYKTPDLKYSQQSEEKIKRKKRQNSFYNENKKNGEDNQKQYESQKNPSQQTNKHYESQKQQQKQLDNYSTKQTEQYQTQQYQHQNDNNFYSKRSDSQTNTRRAAKQQKQVKEIEKLKKETDLLKQVERIRKNIQHSIKKKINEQKLIEKQEKAQKARRQQHSSQNDLQNQQKIVSKSQMQNHCQNCSFLLNRGIPTTYCSCDKNRK